MMSSKVRDDSSVRGPTVNKIVPLNGVSIFFLKRIQAHIRKNNEPDLITTREVVEKYIKDWTKSQYFSLAQQCIPNDKIPHPVLGIIPSYELALEANIYVSHTWSYYFHNLVESLEVFANEYGGVSSASVVGTTKRSQQIAYFWLDFCSWNQWVTFSEKLFDLQSIASLIKRISHTLLVALPWENPIVFKRCWCLYEVFVTKSGGIKLSLQFSKKRQEEFKKIICADYEKYFDDFYPKCDVESSESTNSFDRRKICDCFASLKDSFREANTILDVAIKEAVIELAVQYLSSTLSKENAISDTALHTSENRRSGSDETTIKYSITTLSIMDSCCLAFGCRKNNAIMTFNPSELQRKQFSQACRMKLNLAAFKNEQKKYAEAEAICCDVLTENKEYFGPNHPSSLSILGNLALLYKSQSQFSKAKELYSSVLEQKIRVLGELHPSTLVTMQNLAALQKDIGDLDGAVQSYRTVLLLQEQCMGKQHPDALLSLENLAHVYVSLRRGSEAKELLQTMLHIKVFKYGEKNEETLAAWELIASIDVDDGDYTSALDLLQRAFNIRQTLYGRKHRLTLVTMLNMAECYEKMLKFQEAIGIYQQLIEYSTESFGKMHSHTLRLRDILLGLYKSAGDFSSALALSESLLLDKESVFGEVCYPVLAALKQLVSVHSLLGSPPELYIPYLRRLVAGFNALGGGDGGPTHMDMRMSQYELASCLVAAHEIDEATSIYEELLAAFDAAVGVDSALSRTTAQSLALVYKVKGRYVEAEELCERLLRSFNNCIAELNNQEEAMIDAATLNDSDESHQRQLLNSSVLSMQREQHAKAVEDIQCILDDIHS